MLRFSVVAALLVAGVGCGSRTTSRLVATRIAITPTPTKFTVIASTQAPSGTRILRSLASLVPNPLPPNPAQGACVTGTTVTITETNRVRRYGPCVWPQAIENLRQAFLTANHITVHPSMKTGAALWRDVLEDWYDGRFDQWHSCGAVQEAIHRLPSTTPMFSSVHDDLRAYAHGVC